MRRSTAARTIVANVHERKLVGTRVLPALESKAGKALLTGSDGSQMLLPDSLYEVLRVAARAIGAGQAVTIMPVQAQLTTQQAAEYLQVSRPYLIGLLEKYQIPFHKVGTHRRVYLKDLIAFRAHMERERRAALQQLVDDAQDLNIYDE